MRVHHLNCISECPLGGMLMDGRSKGLRARVPCHCLAVETHEGLVLVDTGFGLGDVFRPRRRLSRVFLMLNSPAFREELTAVRQLERLGFRAEDVRHIIMTHMDFDHAGGIEDFPFAEVHLLAREETAALTRRTLLDRMRYRPAQWDHTRRRWRHYTPGEGEHWYGFNSVRPLPNMGDEIVMVPLVGHTLGHAGVAVKEEAGWTFLTGDAYFWHGETQVPPRCTVGLRAYQWLMDKDHRARRWNQQRLRALCSAHGREVRVFCSHDPYEFESLSGHSLETLPPTQPRLGVPAPLIPETPL